MKPVLIPMGYLIVGPSKFRFVESASQIEAETQALIAEENLHRSVDRHMSKDDVYSQEMFSKMWEGMPKFGEQRGDWDEQFKLAARNEAGFDSSRF